MAVKLTADACRVAEFNASPPPYPPPLHDVKLEPANVVSPACKNIPPPMPEAETEVNVAPDIVAVV